MRFRNWTCGSYGTTAVEEGGKEGAETAEAVVEEEEATMLRVCFRMLSGTAGSGRNSRSSGKANIMTSFEIISSKCKIRYYRRETEDLEKPSANFQRYHSKSCPKINS